MVLTIGKQLGLAFGAVILLMAVSAAMAYFKVSEMERRVAAVVDESFFIVRVGDEMLYGLVSSASALRGYMVLGDDPEQAEVFKTERQVAWQDIDGAMAELKTFYAGAAAPESRRDFQVVQNNLEPLRSAQQRVEDFAHTEDSLRANQLLATEVMPLGVLVRDALERLRDAAVARVAEDRKAMLAAGAAATTTLMATTVFAVVIAFAVAFALSRRIMAAVQSLLAGVQSVAEGDLTGGTLRVATRDEIGQLAGSFNSMVTSLRGLLADSRTMTGEVASSSSEIATASQQQVSSLNQTAASLNQITTTAEQFKATMQEFADRAQAVQEAADETAERANEGRTLTVDSTARIEQVRANSQAAGASVLNLAEQMQRIGEITATVNEIAEQTKLLALNASIEAARAGEEGRGFAVVATQVRELANQSKAAAGRIESLVTDTQKSMQDVVGKIEEGGRLSEDSTELVRRVTEAFDEIVQAISRTREAMSQINLGAKQQEQGITELVASITEIDTGMKESLAAAEQTQKSIVAIDQRIRALNRSVAQFKT